METNKESVQKVKFEGKLEEKKGEKGHRQGIQYTRIDVPNQKEGAVAFKLASQWTEEEKHLIASLNPGDELVITKVEQKYTDSNGAARTSWPIKSVAEVSTWVEKPPKKPWQPNKSSGGGYDSLGNQVGNCVTNAIVSLGAGKTIEQYKQRMLELAEAGNWLRNKLENQTSLTSIPVVVPGGVFTPSINGCNPDGSTNKPSEVVVRTSGTDLEQHNTIEDTLNDW